MEPEASLRVKLSHGACERPASKAVLCEGLGEHDVTLTKAYHQL